MKRLLFAICALLFIAHTSYAQLLGQDHRYSVTLRGNGEAIVTARILFSNEESTPQVLYSLRVPKVLPTDIMAFQVIQQGPCLEYNTKNSTPMIYPDEVPCLRYQEPDMMNWYGPAKYQKAKTEFVGDTIEVTLPQPVQAEKSGSIILYFRAMGYARKNIFGAYTFTFETLKVDDPIQSLQVGVTTDADLLLRGAIGKVNYRFEDLAMSVKTTEGVMAPTANSRMDSYYSQIGQGELTKTASNLQALESYWVRGSFADSVLRLYAKDIGIGLGIIILFAIVMYLFIRRMFQANRSGYKSTGVLAVFGLSFISAITTVGYSIVLLFLAQNMSSVFGYQSQAPITLLLLVISLGVYGLLLGAPALFMGMKRGLWYGLATAGLTILWLVLTLLVYIILNVSGQNRSINYPIGVMNSIKSDTQIAPAFQMGSGGSEPSAPLPVPETSQ